MRKILVTGANKGIGLAIAKAILEHDTDTFVFLGSRDPARGREAAASLERERAEWRARVEVVPLDVSSDASVAEAKKLVASHLGSDRLYGLVNNAGIGVGSGGLGEILNVNAVGIHRVVDAFLPLLDATSGRIVNVTSASGPTFVATCSPAMQRFFLDGSIAWPKLHAFIDECVALEGKPEAFAARGLGDGSAYGLSKACANLYTLVLAREQPSLRVNACTPGFIETDMTRHYVASQGKPAAELGMKPPSEGAKAPLFLLFGELEGSGRYYGSDAQRSPLDRYRAPGSAPYAG